MAEKSVEQRTNPRGPGRPRDEKLRTRILNSAAYLLEHSGFSEITMEAIADRSGASKATVYRWWPNKAAVLIEAFREVVAGPLPFPETGSLRDNMLQQLSEFAGVLNSGRGRILAAFLAAAQDDPEVAQAYRDIWMGPRRTEAKHLLKRHCASGEAASDLDLDCAIEVLYSPLYFRLLTGWQPISDAYIRSLVDTALKGICR